MKSLIKTLFILTIFISSFSIYGYNLKYKAETTNIKEDKGYYGCEITLGAQASKDTIDEYDDRIGETDKDGWLPGGGSDRDTSGGYYDFDSFAYVFRLSGDFTEYKSEFVKSGTSNNIYYDTYPIAIDSGFDSVSDFKGVKANVPENQGNRTNGYLTMSLTDSSRVIHSRWKVLKPNNVVIVVYNLTSKAVGELVEKFGIKALSKEGIKFSNILRTKDDRFDDPKSKIYSKFFKENKSYMDTAWVYYQMTVGRWNSGGRGFVETDIWTSYGTGKYKPGASVANLFDNTLIIPVVEKESIKRQIYINHIDEKGNILPGFENSKLNLVDLQNKVIGTKDNAGPSNGFKEYYTITGDEGIIVKKSDKTKIGEDEYQFLRGESGVGTTLKIAKETLKISKNVWQLPYTFRTNPKEVDDFVVVNLVYKKITPPPPPPPIYSGLPPLEIIGRLVFTNKKDNEYINSTSGDILDYIPSTKQLTPYVQDAYPYIVRALRYTTKTEERNITASSTANIQYGWDEWVYSHGNARKFICKKVEHTHILSCYGYSPKGKFVLKCKITPHTHTDWECYEHKHDSTCDWYLQEKSSSTYKSFYYSLPYKHTWFEIENFKMYRISKVEVYDNQDNVGGTLFGGGTYTIATSSKYESRFNNSRGLVKKTLIVSFPSTSYYLQNVNVSKAKPSNNYSTSSGTTVSSQSDAYSIAVNNLSKETHLSASNATSLTISYRYGNDYVELDGSSDMLRENYKTWSERISKESDSNVRDLNSTKEGPGKVNGSDIKYTYNLMQYMKPPKTKQTNFEDFTPNYQTVPENRENGLRLLKGKIFYKVSTDGKYNLGSTSFTSTDATYKLDNLVNVNSPDFKDYDKLYENNDVNKVNVLTPINFGSFQLVTNEKVDHSTGAGNSTILQKNAEFEIKPTIVGSTTAGYNIIDTREFVEGFYFTFDFNIMVDNNNDKYYETLIPALKPIYVAGKYASIKAKTTDNFGSASADQLTNSIKIVAVTRNSTEALKDFYSNINFLSTQYMNPDNNKVSTTNVQNQNGLLTREDIINDSFHAIYRKITTRNLGRVFDFAVTDCSDIAFKDVFRRPISETVNEHNTAAYYAGYKKWDLYSQEYNKMVGRTNIGSTIKSILPLGPYKHLSGKYIAAPKMGYRISFDLKTTGYMAANNSDNNRRVEITPSYYYISKDGKILDNNIKLYFKNSSGNYIDFKTSGYTIYYKPNDGYRYLRNSIYTDIYTSMSTKLEPITVTNKIVLYNSAMSMSNNSFIQSWYGEFKLPNSTIAISNVNGNVHKNINNPYSDGYIGVIFKIQCIDTGVGGFTLSYDTEDKSASSSTNTSQWDYEGFMGFSSPGNAANSISYKLEKGIWNLNNTTYNKVKGTVALFDLDNRAANDFE